MSNTDMDAVLEVAHEDPREDGDELAYAVPAGDDSADAMPMPVLNLLDDDPPEAEDMPFLAGMLDDDPAAGEPVGMPATAVLQLRILSGMHAGACAPLQGDVYMLGALDDCDFVLSDAGVQPHHARLSRLDDGWQLDWVAEEGAEPVLAPMRLQSGKAVPMGPIVVAVDDAQAPWPTLEQLVLVPHAPALEAQLPAPAQPAAAPARRPWGRRLMPVAVVLALLISSLVWLAWPAGFDPLAPSGAGPAAAAATLPVAVPPDAAQMQANKQAIDAALKTVSLDGRVKLEHTAAGWVVHAPVMSEAEGEVLLAALSRIRPRPVLRMTSESELRDEVAAALAQLAGEQRAAVSLHAAGQGRFRIEGAMNSAAARDKLLAVLAESFPHVRGWDNAVATPQDAGTRLLADLRDRGWQASGEWRDGAMHIAVQLQQRDVPSWERTLLAATQAHPVPLRAQMTIVQTVAPVAVAPAAASAAPALPFTVRSVVGGDMPYVLLTNGEKLAQGAVSQGWRLSAVSVNQVVFENGARRAVLTR